MNNKFLTLNTNEWAILPRNEDSHQHGGLSTSDITTCTAFYVVTKNAVFMLHSTAILPQFDLRHTLEQAGKVQDLGEIQSIWIGFNPNIRTRFQMQELETFIKDNYAISPNFVGQYSEHFGVNTDGLLIRLKSPLECEVLRPYDLISCAPVICPPLVQTVRVDSRRFGIERLPQYLLNKLTVVKPAGIECVFDRRSGVCDVVCLPCALTSTPVRSLASFMVRLGGIR